MFVYLTPPPHYDPSVRYRASLEQMNYFLINFNQGLFLSELVRRQLEDYLEDLKCMSVILHDDDFVDTLSGVVTALAEWTNCDTKASGDIINIFEHFSDLVNRSELNISILSLYMSYIHSLNNIGEYELAKFHSSKLLDRMPGDISSDDYQKYSFELLLQLEAAECMQSGEKLTPHILAHYINFIRTLNNFESFEEAKILSQDLIYRVEKLSGKWEQVLNELQIELETATSILSEQED